MAYRKVEMAYQEVKTISCSYMHTIYFMHARYSIVKQLSNKQSAGVIFSYEHRTRKAI